jgi:predicted nucleic acid-binding protein
MACLDSSVIIDILRGRNSAEVIENKLDSADEEIFIPAPVIIELIRGFYLKSSKSNIKENEKERIDKFLSSFVILDLDKESAIKSGEIEAELINSGELIDLEDIMIAAIAVKNDETLITKNKKHFEKIKDLKVQSY